MIAFVHVKLKPNAAKGAIDEMPNVKGVKEVYEIFGEWDGLLKVEADNTDAVNFIVDEIRKKADVEITSTLIVAAQI